MSDGVRVFWSEPTDRVRVSLRRFIHTPVEGEGHPPDPTRRTCTAGSYCDASVVIEDEALDVEWAGKTVDHADPRWPTVCARCGEPFGDLGLWQVNAHTIYAGGGHRFTLDDPSPGAMYDAYWYGDASWGAGPDGLHLVVVLPNRFPWHVDGPASNCTRLGEEHHCWVRHGDPRTGTLHVDKNGDTCSAGAGSIDARGWHGHLHNGVLK